MGIIKAVLDSLGGAVADQWKEIITTGPFDEHVVVAPGIRKRSDGDYGNNFYGSDNVISNGSVFYVPENTACFIFSQGGIENIVTQAGGFEYQDGEDSIFNGDGIKSSVFSQAWDRVGFGGITSTEKKIAFVNLREIRDIKFGTRGPQIYNDSFYGVDLEMYAYGRFSVKIVDPVKFIKYFVPPYTDYYSFDDQQVRSQIVSEFLQSFTTALNSLSTKYRISHVPSQASAIAQIIQNEEINAGTWEERFGFKLVQVGIENIELSDESKELVRKYAENKMNISAYDDVSEKASNIAAQQKIAEGIKENGFGDMPGMAFGMGFVNTLGPQGQQQTPLSPPQSTASAQPVETAQDSPVQPKKMEKPALSLDEQIEALKKLKELVDAGILTQEEFDIKKKEIMGL